MIDELYLRQVCAEVDRVARECDASLPRLKQRSSSTNNLVFKVNENARVPDEEAPSEAMSGLTEDDIEGIGTAIYEERKLRRAELKPIIDDLQNQIDALREQIEAKNVTPMRGRDVA
jgi:hypothetical protein